jgi:hypothetical protein
VCDCWLVAWLMAEDKRRLLTPTKPARVSRLNVDVTPPLSVIAHRYSYLLLCIPVRETAPSFGKHPLHEFACLEHIAVCKHAYSVKRSTGCYLRKSVEMPSREFSILFVCLGANIYRGSGDNDRGREGYPCHSNDCKCESGYHRRDGYDEQRHVRLPKRA